jgi:hypothetical protein
MIYYQGFGGSIPGYWMDNGEKAWEGYKKLIKCIGFPFSDDNEYSKSFEKLELKNYLKDGNSVILMTHMGPTSSQTTVYSKSISSKQINSGSNFLKELISTDESVSSF